MAEIAEALSFVSPRYLCEVELPAEDLARACACHDDACRAARHSIELLVASARTIVIRRQGDIEDVHFTVVLVLLVFIGVGVRVWVGDSGPSTTPADPHLLVVCALLRVARGVVLGAGAPLAATDRVLYNAAQRGEVVEVHGAVV